MDAECALHRGDHALVEQRLGELARLADDYGNEVALATLRSLGALLEMERGHLDAALERIELYRREHDEPSYQIVAFGSRARIETLQGRLDAARASLERGEARIREAGLVTPFHRSFCATPLYQLDLLELEAAQQAGDRRLARRLAARARRSRRSALRVAAKVAARRTEILRAAATHEWLLAHFDRALRGYADAVAVARALDARPELARTCAEIARRLASPQGPDRLDGRDAAQWRSEAGEILRGLGLSHELAALEASAT